MSVFLTFSLDFDLVQPTSCQPYSDSFCSESIRFLVMVVLPGFFSHSDHFPVEMFQLRFNHDVCGSHGELKITS